MSRPPRVQVPGGIYHVMTRGVRKLPIFLDDGDRLRFLSLVAVVVPLHEWICSAYCLMTSHYHLLVTTPEANLGRGMQLLNGVYAQTFNRRHGEVGHVFESRYQSPRVENEQHLLEVTRYIVLNPVRAGTCDDPAEWKWSSYRATLGLATAPRFLALDSVLDL
ncbi:MAG: transposase, partial [Actinomycetota bacterium]|nr:transposase [Actinomycetota bacterium]